MCKFVAYLSQAVPRLVGGNRRAELRHLVPNGYPQSMDDPAVSLLGVIALAGAFGRALLQLLQQRGEL